MSTPRGLLNIGATCYFNSMLQAMLSCPSFVIALSKLAEEGSDMAREFINIARAGPTVANPAQLIQIFNSKIGIEF